jgi:hypothetical protein
MTKRTLPPSSSRAVVSDRRALFMIGRYDADAQPPSSSRLVVGAVHVFEHNTRRGVATVAPTRGRVSDDELADRHGVARCPHCGSATGPHRACGSPATPD